MRRWRTVATFALALAMATAAQAHGSGEERDPHAGESWFSSLKHNESQADVLQEQEELALQRTMASLSCGTPSEIAALDRQSQVLEMRMKIAVARKKRDQARKLGNKKLADKLDKTIHSDKLALMQLIDPDGAAASPPSSRY